MAFNDGIKPIKVVGGTLLYYLNYITTTGYVEKAFGGEAHTITLTNDSTTDTVSISFDETTLGGELLPGESITLYTGPQTSIYLKGVTGGDKVRIWAW